MAEEESEVELDRLKEELESLLAASARDEHGHISKSYCAKFCKLVEEHTGRWQVPLPQLQVLRWALCSFVRGTASFPADCEHVRYTLSSLALSVFELLLFFGKDEFPEDPLKGILDSFQECQACLVRHQNVYLLQLRQIIRDGGPWASAVLQGILKGAPQAPEEVSRFLGSEACVFLELRVRYLLVCERVEEAMALAKACSQHPSAGRHLFFLQAYLTCLWKASFHDCLHTQMSVIDGKDAVEIICGCEGEEDDELLLSLSRGFLSQQLRNGDMFNLWDLVFVWSKLQLRANPSTEDFLQQCQQLIFTATNIRAVFPFIKIILAEVGKCGLRFCVELCARALESDLQSDLVTKSLLYKTVAFLLPSDLEVCRVCALLVFFLERTVESYKTVSLLYTHPDVEYSVDASPVGNHVRFEVLQILKKGLYFDPEFWNLLTLRSTCVRLLSDPLANAELTEILAEEPWSATCCVREPCVCQLDPPDATAAALPPRPASEQRRLAVTVPTTGERPRVPGREAPCRVVGEGKRRGRKPSVKLVDSSSSLRRSFRQLDMAQQNLARQVGSGTLSRQQRVLSRQAERRCWKRRGRKPRWLLEEEAAAQAENSAPGRGRRPGKKPGRRPQRQPRQR
ncbi:hypothetical protein AALO_G00289050 [Alosa alosa]|uniref:Zinc finger protein Rlf/292/654 TPR repeats domain-containing protein n=1 Tax=Alosa alosa TaxID=278164 RepID=A0AAV6FL74_9TELE|nr:hypothetical protein AALO_G00289050 [Alosa alosa]